MNPSIDPAELRKALSCFVTGVTVVTTLNDAGKPRGFTANAFTSVSLDPPLVLVCIGRHATSYPAFADCGHFAVNILAEGQRDVSGTFATRGTDKFANLAWRHGNTGSPLLADTSAWLDCVVHQRVDAGDHLILIGRVVDFAHQSAMPLAFCRGNYLAFGLAQEALAATAADRIRVGALLEYEEHVLLVRDGDTWAPPIGRSLGKERAERGSLLAQLAELGVKADIGFLFAVFEEPDSGVTHIYYRGGVTDAVSLDTSRAELVAFDAVPWERLPNGAIRAMLRRYITERVEDHFGIYVGDTERGTVQGRSRSA